MPRLPRGVRLRYDEVRAKHVLLAPERTFDLDDNAVAVLKLVDGQNSVSQIDRGRGGDRRRPDSAAARGGLD